VNIKWIGFMIAVWVIGMFLGATFEHHTAAAGNWEGATQESTLEYLLNVKHVVYQEDNVGELHFVFINKEYFDTLWQVFTWDFTFLRGEPYEMVRWIVLIPFSIVCALGVAYMFIQLMQGFLRV